MTEAAIRIVVNGEERAIDSGATVHEVVAAVAPVAEGCAVAVNGEVVPRRDWPARVLASGDRIEVLTAVQGG